ncbi:MAG: YjbQ family protein [Rhodospirillaceae bacterium]|jgi:secondary thiamine-phosphate synthase enzyme|nr:YjbQ family protein [Rhodospirillaceae bacterium]
MMKQVQHQIALQTDGRGLVDITREIAEWVSGQAIRVGLLTLFCRHTSASLLIQEDADPSVLNDINTFLERIAPDDASLYRHNMEGADDMPAHIRTMLTQTQISIPVTGGEMVLGTWQGIYLFEHRISGHRRNLAVHLIGE